MTSRHPKSVQLLAGTLLLTLNAMACSRSNALSSGENQNPGGSAGSSDGRAPRMRTDGLAAGAIDAGNGREDLPVAPRDFLDVYGCGKAGERRQARPGEFASYCLCEEREYQGGLKLLWSCYGANPSDPEPFGGVHGAPEAKCDNFFRHGGGAGSCLAIWSECTDDHQYSVSCVDDSCLCLVDGTAKATIESRDCCPSTGDEVNTACGWDLRVDPNQATASPGNACN